MFKKKRQSSYLLLLSTLSDSFVWKQRLYTGPNVFWNFHHIMSLSYDTTLLSGTVGV